MRTRASQLNVLKLHCPHCDVIMFVHLLPRSDSWLQSVGRWQRSRKSFLPLLHTSVDSDRSTLLLKHFLLNSAQTGLQCAVSWLHKRCNISHLQALTVTEIQACWWKEFQKVPLNLCVQIKICLFICCFIFFPWCNSPSVPRPPYCRGFVITLWHTTVGRTHLNEWSAHRRDLYLTTHKTYKRHIHKPGGTRTRNPSKQATADSPRGHWDRRLFI
jgi:hypothetical protein